VLCECGLSVVLAYTAVTGVVALISNKIPPYSMDDFHKLLQKIAVLETKIHRLEVNVEGDGLCGNDTTLPWTQNSGREHANTQLISTNKPTKKQEPG